MHDLLTTRGPDEEWDARRSVDPIATRVREPPLVCRPAATARYDQAAGTFPGVAPSDGEPSRPRVGNLELKCRTGADHQTCFGEQPCGSRLTRPIRLEHVRKRECDAFEHHIQNCVGSVESRDRVGASE